MHSTLDSEPTLAIQKDMSAIEDIHTHKVGNGDIEQLNEKNCHGNKENINGVVKVNEKNKRVINAETETLSNLSNEESENRSKDDSSIRVAVKDETCKENVLETNENTQIEESQCASTQGVLDEDIKSISLLKNELENIEETVQEDEEEEEDEEDIIRLNHNILPIPDIAGSESDKVEGNDITDINELPDTITDMGVKEEPNVVTEEPVPDVQLGEPASTIEKDAIPLQSSGNKDEPSESFDNKDKPLDESNHESNVPVCDSTVEICRDAADSPPIELKDDMDVEEVGEPTKDIDVEEVGEPTKSKEDDTSSQPTEKPSAPVSSPIDKPILCKLSNTLDILSDDEDEPPKDEPSKQVDLNEKQCINIEDDDDIMLIDEDTTKTEIPLPVVTNNKEDTPNHTDDKTDTETGEKTVEEQFDLHTNTAEKASTPPELIKEKCLQINVSEKEESEQSEQVSSKLPLLADTFLKSDKKLDEMTRDELEEYCTFKIAQSIADRTSLGEIKNKLKLVAQGMDEYKKKIMMLTKQNRDLQVVLKSIQEEQKKMAPGTQITPLKITRSVGMQVFMEKTCPRRKPHALLQNSTNNRQLPKSLPSTNLRPQKPPVVTQPIPVPRLVPASPAIKSPSTIPLVNQISPAKSVPSMPNGIKNPSPCQKVAEKRPLNRSLSVTVDLTDDEPPAKVNNRTSPAPPVNNRTSPAPPVRVVPSQTLMANPRQAFPAAVSSPRKVYIPISGPQNQNIRPGQTIMLKTVPTPGLRPRGPTPQVTRQPSSLRATRIQAARHPAPLPDAMKQYQPPNWKALPPSPELKLSKVENGIVISWKIDGYKEDSYEEIASYQLYAYQETSAPPSTTLWKKIGDVKALPLPMACTLTQFMAGFKYYFAVRAVDVRSRLGPFSLPGSILLLNKL